MPWLASHSVSWPRLDTHGVCPTSRRQWADFLVSLMAPLHRQYKTARTETRCHLLLKTWQMAIQTSASRGYVLFRGAIKGHTQKSYKLSSGMRTWPAECSKLGKTRIIEDANIRLVRNTTFFEPNFPLHFHLKSHCVIFWSYYLSNQSTICLLRQFLLFSASRIEFGITHIKVTAVEIVLNHPKSLAEALEVDNLPLT